MVIKKTLKRALVMAALPALLSTGIMAQDNTVAPSGTTMFCDPIVEMLDSLVTLNHVIRYNNLSTFGEGTTSRENLPYYSDEIYQQRFASISSPIPLEYNDQ